MSEPLVSVLLSYYRGEKYLKPYLENVKQQTISKDIELIISACLLTEKEKEIIKLYEKDLHIHLIEFDELKPQSYCWNQAIKVSKADYCCIWNVDDVRMPDSIEKQYRKLLGNNKLVATYGYFIISNEYGNRCGQFIDHSMYDKKEYTRSMLLGPFFMFRKSVCNNIGYFDEQFKSGNDYDFAIRLAMCDDIEMGNFVDGYFLDIGQGLSTKGDNRQPIERTAIEMRYELFDKIENRWVAKAKEYEINKIKQFDKWYNMKEIIRRIK